MSADVLIKGNLYCYCNNLPVFQKDPNGFSSIYDDDEEDVSFDVSSTRPYQYHEGVYYEVMLLQPIVLLRESGEPAEKIPSGCKIICTYCLDGKEGRMKTFFGYSKDDKMVADWEKYFTFSNRTFVCIRDNVEEWEYLYGNKDAYNGTSKKTYVRNIQKDLGMPIDQCDGVFGDITETKVLDFQKLRGIKEDGRVGYITKVELYKYILSNFQ